MKDVALRPADDQAPPLAPVSTPPSMLNFIAAAVTDPSVDVAKLEALLRMQKDVLAEEARAQFNRALAALSGELPQIEKRGTVRLGEGKGSYQFARWEDMDKVLRPLMQKHGFTLSFSTRRRDDGGGAIVVGELLHAGGHSKSAEVSLPLDSGAGRNNLQALGSTIAYGKRYLAEMLLNIVRCGQDDDGEQSGHMSIDADSVHIIRKLLADTRADVGAFLRFFGAQSVETLRQADYPKAVNALMAKAAKAAAKETAT